MPSCQARGHSSHCGYTRWWSSSRPGAPCSHNTPRSWKLVVSLLQVYKTHVIDGLPIKPTKLQPPHTRHLISLQLIVDSWQSSKNLRRWMRHLKLKCQNQNVALCLWSDGENARRFSPSCPSVFIFLSVPPLHLVPLLSSKRHSIIGAASLSSMQHNISLKVTAIICRSKTKREKCQVLETKNKPRFICFSLGIIGFSLSDCLIFV